LAQACAEVTFALVAPGRCACLFAMSYAPETQGAPQNAYPTASFTPALEQVGGGASGAPLVMESVGGGGVELAAGPGPQYSAQAPPPVAAPSASYIGPTTYAPTKYVSADSGGPSAYGSYAAPTTYAAPSAAYAGPQSYSPIPSTQYVQGQAPYSPIPSSQYMPAQQVYGGSYQPPAQQYTGTSSYTPAVVDGAMYGQQGPPQTGSYVSAPGPPPPKLTEGMPDPSSVESQKLAYSKSIEAQLRQETGALAQRNQAQKQSLAQMVQQQKAQYNLQMDQYLQQQAMAVDQQANAEMMMLQEAAMAQKMALEQQAAGLALEYQQRKAQEEMMAREYQIQKQYWDAEQKLAAQYQKQHGIDGRLSEQQLAMGHAAISSMGQGQGPPGTPMNAPMTTTTTMGQPMSMSRQVLPPMSAGGMQTQQGGMQPPPYAMPPGFSQGPPQQFRQPGY